MSAPHRRSPERSGARGASAFRRERLARLVLDALRSTLRDDARHPGLEGVVLLRLDLSPDASHARVAYAVRPEPGAVDEEPAVERRTKAALEAASGYLRARLAGSLDLKRLPRLGFTFVGLARTDVGTEEPCLD